MINPARYFTEQFRPLPMLVALLGLLCWSAASLAKPYSDLLLVVDQDGLGYTAQLTVFADKEMIISRVPAGRDHLETVFAGPNSALYQRAYETNPDKLTVISGSVFTRFRHRFEPDENSEGNNTEIITTAPVIRASLNEFSTTMVDSQSLAYRVSWLLPPNIELLNRGSASNTEGVPDGVWSKDDDTIVVFELSGATPSELWIEYRVHTDNKEQACLASVGPSEWCSPDADNDGVPDYRDLCLAEQSDQTSLPDNTDQDDIVLADNSYSTGVAVRATAVVNADSLGCEDDSVIVLPQVQFESGQTYLNAKTRASLDKLAIALQRIPDKLFRIASFTDNAGYFENNQRLSENRAAAIRHYLMLRGVSPNQIKARGYGETQPAHDNRTMAGRRNNRRVELQLLN